MIRLLFAVFLLGFANIAYAQQSSLYSTRPMRIVVPFTAGGYADILARTIAEGMSTQIRQPVIVENRPGGFVVIGAQHVINQPADGHTLMITGNGLAAYRRFNPDITLDLHREFSIASVLVKSPLVTVVSRSTPIQDARQLIDMVLRSPELYSFGSMGGGGISGMGAILFLNAINGKMLNVPYNGIAPAQIDIQAGRLDSIFSEVPSARQLIESGQRAIMVSSSTRTSLFPDVPTWRELGVNQEFYAFQAFWVRSNTSRETRIELNRLITNTLNMPETRRKLVSMGLHENDIVNDTLDGHEQYIRNEINRWPPSR